MNMLRFAVVLSALAAILAGGMALHSRSRPAPVRPIHVVMGFDTSISFRPHLGTAALLAARLASHLDGETDYLTLFRVDQQTSEFYDNAAPDSAETLQQTLNTELAPRPYCAGTFPSAFWKEAVRCADNSRQPLIIFYHSDGDNDDMRGQAEADMQRDACRLAANPHVRAVAFCGVTPSNRQMLRRLFAPLGHRALFYGPTDLSVDTLVSLCELARR